MKEKILIIGAGGHAKVCIDVINQGNKYHIYGCIGKAEEVGQYILNYPIIGTNKDLPMLLSNIGNVHIAIGQIKSSSIRVQTFELLKELGAYFPNIVSPFSYVSEYATIGEGTIIMPGAIIQADAKVGKNCIINTQCIIEHDVHIGDHTHVSTASTINGGTHVGSRTFIGSGVKIREMLTIGSDSFIGMGQIILKNCPSDTYLPLKKEKIS